VTPAGEMYLRIKDAKTGERAVSLPQWAWEAYSELVQRRRKDPDSAKNPDQALLFVRYRANGTTTGPVSQSTFYRRYKRILAAAGLPGYAPHSARATFATRLLSQGVDAITVSRALGHATADQVIMYDKRFSGPDVQPQRALDYK
jgi:integrase